MTAVDPSSVNVPRVTIPASAVEALADEIGSIASGIETTVVASARFGKLRDVQRQLRRLVDNALWPDNHGGRGWEATETGWRCTECHHEVTGPVDVHIDDAHVCAPVPVSDEADAEPSALDQRLTNLLAVCDAYKRGDELTPQQIDRFHNLADMATVRWLIRTVWGMTAHRDSLQRQLDAARRAGAGAQVTEGPDVESYRAEVDILKRTIADLRARLDKAADLCRDIHEEALDFGWSMQLYEVLGIEPPDWYRPAAAEGNE